MKALPALRPLFAFAVAIATCSAMATPFLTPSQSAAPDDPLDLPIGAFMIDVDPAATAQTGPMGVDFLSDWALNGDTATGSVHALSFDTPISILGVYIRYDEAALGGVLTNSTPLSTKLTFSNNAGYEINTYVRRTSRGGVFIDLGHVVHDIDMITLFSTGGLPDLQVPGVMISAVVARVSEPSQWWLLLAGSVAILVGLRRRIRIPQ